MIAPHYDTEHATLYLGDCLDVLTQLPDESVRFHCIAIEREPTYMPLVEARMQRPMQGSLFDL